MLKSPLHYRTVISALRSTLATSLGFSRRFNSRNLEHYWYPSWNHTLVELISDIPNLIVAPQFPLWVVEGYEEQEEDEGPDDGEDLAEPEVDEQQDEDEDENDLDGGGEQEDVLQDLEIADDVQDNSALEFIQDEDIDIGDISFSSGTTIPQPHAHSQIVDYAIVHVSAQLQPKLPERYGGWQITEQAVPVLIEEKRYPSRSLTQAQLEGRLKSRLEEAQQGLMTQAAHLFYEFPSAKSVIAIAASGPYWSNTTIARKHSLSREEFTRVLKTRDFTPLRKLTKGLKWTVPLRLDTYKSNVRFQTIYNRLRKLPPLHSPMP